MAKTKTTKAEIEAEAVIQTLVLLPENASQSALSKFTPFDEQLKNLLLEADSLPEITDKLTLKKVVDTSKNLRRFEISIDKTRIASTEPIREILSDLKFHCDGLIAQSESKRKTLDDKINAEEKRLQEQAKKEHIRRVELLTTNGWAMTGQFYACGVYRIMFDEVDAADEVKLAEWVKTGQEFLAAEAARVEAEAARLKEIQDREAALKKQEDEYQEFLAWKAIKSGVTNPEPVAPPPALIQSELPPPPPPVAPQQELGFEWTPQSPAMNPANSSFNAPVNVPANNPVYTHAPAAPSPVTPEHKSPQTEKELAEFRGVSISDLRKQPEAKIYWNMAIDNVLLRFQAESHTKVEWTEIFRNMLRK